MRPPLTLSGLLAVCFCFPAVAQEAAPAAAPAWSWPQHGGLGFVAIVVLFLIVYGIAQGLLRDRKPYDALAGIAKKEIPYSLSRFQMVLWTAVILLAYIFLAFTTGNIDLPVGGQALALMGISGGTALGAAIVDSQTSDGAALDAAFETAKKAQRDLAAAQAEGDAAKTASATQTFKVAQARLRNLAPKSTGFLKDILSDANGINLHRVQMLAWTLVVIVMFIAGVSGAHAMPAFNETLLALMGISNGVYLGFKIPETQAE